AVAGRRCTLPLSTLRACRSFPPPPPPSPPPAPGARRSPCRPLAARPAASPPAAPRPCRADPRGSRAPAAARPLVHGASVLAGAGVLGPAGYVGLLAASSLLHAWGSAGTYTLVAELLPDEDRVAGNALLSTFGLAAVIVGPALAGALTASIGAAWVIGLDAV